MDRLKIVVKGNYNMTLAGNTGESLMDILNDYQDAGFAFPCGGNGVCGKCVIKVLEGDFDITAEDKKFFTEGQLLEGYRLACRAIVREDCVIEYRGVLEKSYDVQSGFIEISSDKKMVCADDIYGIAVDIGTTTIAISLVDIGYQKIVTTFTEINHQRRFGADVIARIQAANDGKNDELRRSIQMDLITGIVRVLKESDIYIDKLQQIVIAGNTTMGHLLLGYSCSTIGVYPFNPVDISAKTLSFGEVFDSCYEKNFSSECLGKEGDEFFNRYPQIKQVPIYFVPGISAYVGADITSGIMHCKMIEKKDVSLLIDLGTNGEMAIGNCDKLLVTSTAAGPAFEGGNISCGTGSVDGAVCDVIISDDNVKLKTINDAPVSGICGTGVIAVTAELIEHQLVDETGRLKDDYFEDGFLLGTTNRGDEVSFTQKDIREIQLAKSAVRAGIETLILRYGIEKKDISNVYIAGGFGYHIDLNKAVKIGLLPEEFIDRISAVGNSALGGAVHTLTDRGNKDLLVKICDMAEEVSLSDDKYFQEFYMEYMMFEEEV